MPIRLKMMDSSLVRAMFTSRWVFSMILAASATLMLLARCTPALTTSSYTLAMISALSAIAAAAHLHDAFQGVLLVALD
jgi:hypothetical protein